MRLDRFALLLGLLALLAALGCESRASVTGQVTFDGKKLERGYITFYPLTEQGQPRGARAETRGAEIVDGAFTVTGLSPGKRKAVISVPPRLSASKAADRTEVRAAPPAVPIGPTTRGNSQVIELRDGSQTLEFALARK